MDYQTSYSPKYAVSRYKTWIWCISRDEARDRLKEAVQAYEEGEGSLSISQAARLYVVSKTTMYNRINGR